MAKLHSMAEWKAELASKICVYLDEETSRPNVKSVP